MHRLAHLPAFQGFLQRSKERAMELRVSGQGHPAAFAAAVKGLMHLLRVRFWQLS